MKQLKKATKQVKFQLAILTKKQNTKTCVMFYNKDHLHSG